MSSGQVRKLLPIFLLTLVNALGFSLLIPVLPIVIRGWGMPDWTFGILLSVYSLCLFWAAPIFGKLSDRYGRRRLLLLSQAGTLLSWLAFAGLWLLETRLQVAPLWLLMMLSMVRIIDGVTGGNNSVTQAYLSDVTSAASRAAYFGYLAAIFGLGMIIGPAIGAYSMASPWGYLATALFGTALSLVTLIAIALLLPETLRQGAPGTRLDLIRPFRLATALGELRDQPIVQNVMVVNLFQSAAMGAYISIMIFYLMDQIGLEETEVGNFLFVVGGFAIFNQMVMIRPIIRLLGSARTLLLGLVLMASALCALPFLASLWSVIFAYYFLNLGINISIPTMKAVVSNQTSEQNQGEILGLFESINSLMFGIMPIVATAIYSGIASLSFLLWGLLAGLGFLFMLTRCPTVLRAPQPSA
jgi:DHA1 family tetracycline resistance protein-like MFS transporter